MAAMSLWWILVALVVGGFVMIAVPGLGLVAGVLIILGGIALALWSVVGAKAVVDEIAAESVEVEHEQAEQARDMDDAPDAIARPQTSAQAEQVGLSERDSTAASAHTQMPDHSGGSAAPRNGL
jgi:hypothetical protein